MAAQQPEYRRRIGLLALRRYLTEDFFDDSQLLRLVVNHKIPFVTQLLDMVTQNPDAKRMKGANRRTAWECGARSAECGVLCQARDQPGHALVHFARGLVGERHTEDVFGREAFPDQVGDAAGDDTGLARARAGEDQNRPVESFHGQALLRVQRVQMQHCGGV